MKQTAASHDTQKVLRLSQWVKLGCVGVVLVMTYWFVRQYDMIEYLQPAHFVEFIQDFGMLAPLVFVGIMALAVIVSPIPSLPLDLVAGAAFGPFLGTVYAVIGAEIGAIVSFLIGRWLGRDVIARLLRSDVVFCEKCSDHHLIGFVFLARLLPVFSFDLVSYGAGLTTMSLKAFALATFVGMVPPTFALVYFGSSVLTDDWLVILLGLVLVGLLVVLPKLIMQNQSSWWVRLILGEKLESNERLSSAPEPVLSSEPSRTCSWCGAKEQGS